jgi:thiamine biosynthesis lipoprotein
MDAVTGKPKRPNRRDVLRILAVGGAAGVAWRLGLFDRLGPQPVSRAKVLMGTGVHLTVLGDDREAAEAAADATLARMAELEALLSRHRPDSEVSRLNSEGSLVDASDALLDVLRRAEAVSRLGQGAFDVTVQPLLDLYRQTLYGSGGAPSGEAVERVLQSVGHRELRVEDRRVTLGRSEMRITLDGIGKGYVVDRGVDVLRGRGFDNVFVEAGGDLVASGAKAEGQPWRIGIRSPRPGVALQARFDAADRAVATSGDYMQPFTNDFRQHHIIDPRTGYSSPELASSTVVAPDAATADALATLTMVLGAAKARELIEEIPNCEGYFVTKQLEVVRTTGFSVV